MPIYRIRGHDVDFPHDAYPCQITYMDQVLAALEQSENALLESPTGTGKTLCLLCATLAWREAFMKQRKAPESSALTLYDYKQQQAGIGAPADPAAEQHKGPSIIYTSRTHSQLAQVIKELGNTAYKVRTTVLGSRQQLCLHDKVSKMAGQGANFTCRALVQHKQCRWHMKSRHDRVVQELSASVPAPIDIEELCKVGRHTEVCPYFLSRDLAGTADVIFMPYNYLVDTMARSQLSTINWSNAVIIVDEAHNIQDACNNNASFDLTGEQVLNAIGEMEAAQKVVKENISSGRASEGQLVLDDRGQQAGPVGAVTNQAELVDRLRCGVKILSAFYQKLCELDPTPAEPAPYGRSSGGYGSGAATELEGLAQKGEALLTLLAELDITPDSYGSYLQQLLLDAIGVLSDHELASGRAMAVKAGVVAGGLSAVMSALDITFASIQPLWSDPVRRTTGPPAYRGYRLFIHRSEPKGGKKLARNVLMSGGAPTLSFWCFIPGVSMAALRQMPLRSVLLTSGTLSPLESFAHELQLGFKHTLENPHVIKPNQVWVGVIPSGPTSVSLNSSYANRNSDKYKDDLGHSIVNFARVVPDGLLVFFPAYSLLQTCLDHWKMSTGSAGGLSIWERILRHKAPVIEPRESSAFAAAIADYQAKLDDPAGNGAVLFAVCRGKVSEGIDFSDKAGRGVVITGLPFPAAHDPHVKLQRQLLDEESRVGSAGIMGGRGLTGEQWYVQQGLRAVNQAMGRVIRHRWDYGAVLLADERFGAPQNQRQLSKWLREHVVRHASFGAAIGSLTKFFKDKGDLVASAAAAQGGGNGQPAAVAKSTMSAFQLVGGADGSSMAAAAAQLTAGQQRRQQLAAAPRAIDVLGILGADGSGGPANSQLDNLLTDASRAAGPAHLPGRQQQGLAGSIGGLTTSGRQQLVMPAAQQANRSQRSSIALQYESDQGMEAQQEACNVVGPARLIEQHKLRQRQQQQQQQGVEPAAGQQAGQAAQQHPNKLSRRKEPLRMGQFLKTWNSTQLEQQKEQALLQQQQQQQQQSGGKAVVQQAGDGNAEASTDQQAVSAELPSDPKAFMKLLQKQLPAEQMAAVKGLLGAYKSDRNLTVFADGLIAALGSGGISAGGSSNWQLVAGFASFMPKNDRDWFLRLVSAGAATAAAGAPAGKQQAAQGRPIVQSAAPAVGAGAAASAAASATAASTLQAQAADNVQQTRHRRRGQQPGMQQADRATGTKRSSNMQGNDTRNGTNNGAPAAALDKKQKAEQATASTSNHHQQQQQRHRHQQHEQQHGPLSSSSTPVAAAGTAGRKAQPGAAAGLPAVGALSCKPCCVCRKAPMSSAYKAGCGHLACYSCWLDLLTANLRGVPCPMCSKLVRRQQLAQVPFA